MKATLYHGDCLEQFNNIADGSVDLILTDPPYGTTACKWDSVIPFEPMWRQVWRVLKPNGAAVFTASQPFTSALVMSNPKKFRHAWVWDKRFAGNVMQAKRQPLKTVEDVLVFSTGDKSPAYFPQMEKRDAPIKAGGLNSGGAIPNMSGAEARAAIKTKIYDEKYPTSILKYNVREGRGLHPTQKPVALMEYLIKTYTNEGETVLDFTMGSGTTGVACKNTNRKFIGIERDEKYFQIASERILGPQDWI
jgi:site-specific DNA-methyltransferase (adenine-specific)